MGPGPGISSASHGLQTACTLTTFVLESAGHLSMWVQCSELCLKPNPLPAISRTCSFGLFRLARSWTCMAYIQRYLLHASGKHACIGSWVQSTLSLMEHSPSVTLVCSYLNYECSPVYAIVRVARTDWKQTFQGHAIVVLSDGYPQDS